VASIYLICTKCWSGYGSVGEVPVTCPACNQVTRWVTKFPVDVPSVRYVLNVEDTKLLRSFKIDPETGVKG